MATYDFKWAIDEPVEMTQKDKNTYVLVRLPHEERTQLTISAVDDGCNLEYGLRLLFNGEHVDVGDDFMAFISMVDDYHEQLGGEIGKTVLTLPYEDEPEPIPVGGKIEQIMAALFLAMPVGTAVFVPDSGDVNAVAALLSALPADCADVRFADGTVRRTGTGEYSAAIGGLEFSYPQDRVLELAHMIVEGN